AGSKARVVTYRNLYLQAGVGLASKDSWLINMNSWLKPREKKAAKVEMTCPTFQGPRSQTKQAMASGTRAGISRASLGQMMLGVKREPKSPVPRSRQGTPETLVPARAPREVRGEIGSKRMPRVMPGIDLVVNPKGCRLPV
ncbi:MAG: hypothetical protein ACTSU9_00185, partial [Promethearchaeota archaeon]